MKTLQEIKDEVAKEAGSENYKDMLSYFEGHELHEPIDKIIKAYAKQALEEAAERAKERFHKGDYARVDQFFQDRIKELK